MNSERAPKYLLRFGRQIYNALPNRTNNCCSKKGDESGKNAPDPTLVLPSSVGVASAGFSTCINPCYEASSACGTSEEPASGKDSRIDPNSDFPEGLQRPSPTQLLVSSSQLGHPVTSVATQTEDALATTRTIGVQTDPSFTSSNTAATSRLIDCSNLAHQSPSSTTPTTSRVSLAQRATISARRFSSSTTSEFSVVDQHDGMMQFVQLVNRIDCMPCPHHQKRINSMAIFRCKKTREIKCMGCERFVGKNMMLRICMQCKHAVCMMCSNMLKPVK